VSSPSAFTRRAFLAAGAACAAGCAIGTAPPLARIYRRDFGASDPPPPLIVIPGAFGSVLTYPDSDRELWPGSSFHMLVSSYKDIALPFDEDTLEPRPGRFVGQGMLRDRLFQDFYGALLRTLERAGGFRRGTPGTPALGGRTYYPFVYDWRLDNSTSAIALHALIERIRADYGDPHLKVDILGHSNGGMLARYYARFGPTALPESGDPAPTAAGAAAIRRLLLVGTPNLGTLQPALGLIRGEEMGLRKVPQEVVVTCSGALQLLPNPAVAWLADAHGRDVERDVFSIDTWRELGWCLFDREVRERTVAEHGGGAAGRRYLAALERYFARHLERGRRFATLLAQPSPPGDARVFLFGADCSLTLSRVVVERIDGQHFAREAPGDIQAPVAGVDYEAVMFEPGDLVVTRDSLVARSPRTPNAVAVEHAVFLCEEHRKLTGNASFQDNLLHTLLAETP
jgi:pimeloyl-ACP methyl ester carboxylesterase